MSGRKGCEWAFWVARLLVLASVAAVVFAGRTFGQELFKERWVYLSKNLLVDQQVDEAVVLMERARKADYTHVLLVDSKYGELPNLGKDLDRYIGNSRRFKAECERIGIRIIPGIFPIGWSNSLLSQDPNLAEGVPVRDAPFEVQGRRAKAVTSAETTLLNGDFEDAAGDRFGGWTRQDAPGRASFADHETVHGGRTSVRMENVRTVEPRFGECRLSQKVKVTPFRCYHLSVWIRTQDLKNPNSLKLWVVGGKWPALSYKDLGAAGTQDWTRHHVVFNSLDCDEVTIGIGTWRGEAGTVWWDDLTIEEPGLVNVLRRGGCPLKVTSSDGRREYVEGRDFEPVHDPRLGVVPWPGMYEVYHTPPDIVLKPGSAVREGEKLLVSFYHPMIIYRRQVTIALSEPRTYEILDDQMKRLHAIWNADGYVMSHDEIRVGNWTPDSLSRNMTPGQIIADNVRRCIAIIRKYAPNATIYAWSGMFDPNHCATELYYLNNGSLVGAWEGIDSSVVIIPWWRDGRDPALKWFADRGHRQVIAGYYDRGPEAVRAWIESARNVKGVYGMMYTTWVSKYDDLEAFARELK